MPETVNGLPLHPLVVHAVVVLLPLAALGVIALAVRPAWRGRYGILVVVLTLLATVAIPVATESGESLEARVGDPGRHAELGDTLLWFALPLLLAAVALVWLDWRANRTSTRVDDGNLGATTDGPAGPAGPSRALAAVVAVLAVLIAVGNLVQVYRVGESGARAAWGDKVSAAPAQSRHR